MIIDMIKHEDYHIDINESFIIIKILILIPIIDLIKKAKNQLLSNLIHLHKYLSIIHSFFVLS